MIDSTEYIDLPDVWKERLFHLEEHQVKRKKLQTIKFWLEEYETRQSKRQNITARTKGNKRFRLGPFKKWINQDRHVTSINEDDITGYHGHLYEKYNSIDSQKTYYGNFKSFVRWMKRQVDCEFCELPLNFDDVDIGQKTWRSTEGL